MTQNHKDKKVVIVGAGFSALSCAALLARQGYNVTVVEKNSHPGGRADFFEEKGFRFDMGPSWYMMPEVFDSFFNLFGKNTGDFYKLKRLNPTYRAFFGSRHVDIEIDRERIYEVFENIEKGSSKKLGKILELGKNLYDVSMSDFLYRDSKYSDFMNLKMAKIFLGKKLFDSYDSFIKKSIKHPDLRKLLTWHTVFLGGTPKNVPALYILMLHVDMNLGTFYPEGGMFEVSKAFENLSLQLGVRFIYGKEVKKISVENFKAKGVEIEGDFINADIVVCNADYHHVQTKLLEKQFRDFDEPYWDKRVMSPGTFLCYLGIRKKLDQILHHNYFFTDYWDHHFDSISKKRSWPEKFSYYVSCRSKSDGVNAPENSENIMLLVPLAPDLVDDDDTRENFKEKLLDNFERDLGENIRDKISVIRISTHRDQISRYNAYKGNSFGLANTLFQTGPLRPSNKSKKIHNLFYTGTGTIPGIGVPLTVISGQVTAEKIIKENAKQKTP